MILRDLNADRFQALLDALKSEAKVENIQTDAMGAISGTVAGMGAKVRFEYHSANGLEVEVLSKPFLLKKSFVEGKIRNWFDAKLGAPQTWS